METPHSRRMELFTLAEEAQMRKEFEGSRQDSFGFRRSRREAGSYTNPQIERDWKSFVLGVVWGRTHPSSGAIVNQSVPEAVPESAPLHFAYQPANPSPTAMGTWSKDSPTSEGPDCSISDSSDKMFKRFPLF